MSGITSEVAGVATGIGNAVGDLFTVSGEEQAAGLYGQAATAAGVSATEEQAAGRLQQIQTSRQVNLIQGTAQANAAAGNLKIGGSAAAILRSNATQGALANQLTGEQTQINVDAYMQQQLADKIQQSNAEAAAKAEKANAFGSFIGAGIDAIGAVAAIAAL